MTLKDIVERIQECITYLELHAEQQKNNPFSFPTMTSPPIEISPSVQTSPSTPVVSTIDPVSAAISLLSKHPMLLKCAIAIRDYEGAPGDLNYQLNNPGDCRPSKVGYLPVYGNVEIINTNTDPRYPFHKGNFAKFPTYNQGWLYLLRTLETKAQTHPSWTLYEFIADPQEGFSPAADGNNCMHYAIFLAKRLGVTVDWCIRGFL